MLCYEHLDLAIKEYEHTGSVYRAFNYEICNAVDLTSTCIILDRMESLGLTKAERLAIEHLIRSANTLFRQANDRLNGKNLSNFL